MFFKKDGKKISHHKVDGNETQETETQETETQETETQETETQETETQETETQETETQETEAGGSVEVEETEIDKDAKIAALEAQVAKFENKGKIENYAKALGLPKVGAKAIENGSSLEVALCSLLDAHLEKGENISKSFSETASESVGVTLEESNDITPQSIVSAMRLISKRDDVSKTEARKIAKIEFPELFKSKVEGE